MNSKESTGTASFPGEQVTVRGSLWVPMMRIAVPPILTVTLFIVAGQFFLYPQLRRVITESEKNLVQQVTRSAWSILDQYERRAQAGDFTREEAQARAIAVIRGVRFGEQKLDYLWIIDHEPRMIMHPYRSELEGQNVGEYTDLKGSRLFIEMTRLAEEHGEGFLEYSWQVRDDAERIVPKLSYIEVYEPWGWIIGSGAYLHEIEEDIDRWLGRAIGATGLILTIVTALSAYMVMTGLRTERARQAAAANLAMRTRALVRSNQELEQFAYIASHDLQEPLRKVTGFLGLLEERYRDRLDEEARGFIAYAVHGAKRMKHMIDDLLEYSRVETQGQDFGACDCNTVLAEALRDLELPLAETGAEVHSDHLPTVRGDFGQLRQLFVNLIGNALKYRTDAPPHVEIAAQREGAQWRISVRDNGTGIAPEYHDKVFLIFQRATRNDSPSGTGIGLAICKRIVERHGGRIGVESQKGEGSVFWFTLKG